AVERLIQSIHELCHATKPPSQVLQNRSWGILRGFLIDGVSGQRRLSATVSAARVRWRSFTAARHTAAAWAGGGGSPNGRTHGLNRVAGLTNALSQASWPNYNQRHAFKNRSWPSQPALGSARTRFSQPLAAAAWARCIERPTRS